LQIKNNSNDTTVRITKHIREKLVHLKTMLNITSDDKRFCFEDVIDYAIDFTIKNDKSIEKIRDELTYAVHRGRLY
jgi:hypothetical protein